MADLSPVEQAEQAMREALANLFEKMDAAAQLGVDVSALVGELAQHAVSQAEAAGEEISPLVKMLFS